MIHPPHGAFGKGAEKIVESITAMHRRVTEKIVESAVSAAPCGAALKK